MITSDKAKISGLANPAWLKWSSWLVAAIIIGLNVKLLVAFAGVA